MKDIVERLRQWRKVPGLRDSCPPFLGEAADEIERLREWRRIAVTQLAEADAEIERLRVELTLVGEKVVHGRLHHLKEVTKEAKDTNHE